MKCAGVKVMTFDDGLMTPVFVGPHALPTPAAW